MVEQGDLAAGLARSLIGLNNATEIGKKLFKKNFQ